LFRRAQKEYLLVKNICKQLHSTRSNMILRRIDKSKVFHLGSRDDYQQKAYNYMTKTAAYEEAKNGKCPLADNLSLVIKLLDGLLKKKVINRKQWSTMMPHKDKVELGHLYFLPKPHKVRSHSLDFTLVVCLTNVLVHLLLDWYTIETNHIFDDGTNN
jgi:hypothetical protein